MYEFESGYWHALDKARPQVETSKIGYTTSSIKDQLEELKAKIFTGASHVELGFSGVGKGTIAGGKVTPGLFGKDQREEMRQLSKVNEVSLSTHATTGIMGLSGVTERGGFSENARKNAMDEIKQAIEFNADVGGSATVVHVGEFNRRTGEWIEEGKTVRQGFIDYGEGIPETLVDGRTGDAVISFNKKSRFEIPEIKINPETGHAEIKPIEISPGRDAKTVEEAKDQIINVLRSQVRMEEGRSKDYGRRWESAEKTVDLYDKMPDSQKLEMIRHYAERGKGGEFEEILKLPKIEDALKRGKEILKREAEILKTEAEGFAMRHIQYEKFIDNLKTSKQYGLEKTSDSLAEAGMFAMQQTKDKKLDKPIFVAPENIFPEQYGGHPEELKEIVIKSRKRMQELLKEKGMPEEKAKELSQTHIKATFDTGHAYLWRKYFDPKKTDKDFNKWMLDQADDLVRSKVVGHVHVTDNMGYADDHLPMGEGKVPIERFTEILSKREFKGNVIAEAGDRDFGAEPAAALRGAWKTMGSPMYRVDSMSDLPIPSPGMGRQMGRGWVDIEQSYFGRTTSPTYLVGEKIVPSKDWVFWTEVPLE
ncbi:MAG: TIM barrel protein [Candidatus Nanoarchaeia archaeon]|nr:TIM barrel protein [Candidatus Nanoarchaeia archaeon]